MQRTVYDLQVDGANIERQIAEKELEISVLRSKLSELKLEHQRYIETAAVNQRDNAHAQIQAQAQAQAQAQETTPVPVPAVSPQ